MKIIWLIALAALLFAPVSAQDSGTVIEPSPALLAHIDELENYAIEIRGLAPLTPVSRYFPSKEDLTVFLSGQFEDEATIESLIEYEIIYKAFGLLAPDIDLLTVYHELLVDQIGGYYDPETKRMNTLLLSSDTLGDALPLLEQIVYVHEYTHALQDQYYDLNSLLSDELAAANPDASAAIQALVEGDASEVMTLFVTALTEDKPDEVMSQLGDMLAFSASADVPAGTPDILTQELTFSYTQGQAFVEALIAEGGYAAVDAAFLNPPVSTEQIIHPEKYLAGELPIVVEMTDNAASLGDGWILTYDKIGGEYFLRNWLKQGLGVLQIAVAASGWGGDRYQLYTNPEGQVALEWKLVFDTPTDQEQFLEYLPKGLTYQFGEPTADGMCWEAPDAGHTTCYAALPDNGVLITRAPSLALATALLG